MLLHLFFFIDTSPTQIYPLSLHDALPILPFSFAKINQTALIIPLPVAIEPGQAATVRLNFVVRIPPKKGRWGQWDGITTLDRKSTRLNSSHANISYAVFCLKKKNIVVQHT